MNRKAMPRAQQGSQQNTSIIRFRFYFVGEFDVSPFSNMVVSILPEVVSQIESTDELSAIYRLLRYIPELSNVSER
jgi:hypothetical protein